MPASPERPAPRRRRAPQVPRSAATQARAPRGSRLPPAPEGALAEATPPRAARRAGRAVPPPARPDPGGRRTFFPGWRSASANSRANAASMLYRRLRSTARLDAARPAPARRARGPLRRVEWRRSAPRRRRRGDTSRGASRHRGCGRDAPVVRRIARRDRHRRGCGGGSGGLRGGIYAGHARKVPARPKADPAASQALASQCASAGRRRPRSPRATASRWRFAAVEADGSHGRVHPQTATRSSRTFDSAAAKTSDARACRETKPPGARQRAQDSVVAGGAAADAVALGAGDVDSLAGAGRFPARPKVQRSPMPAKRKRWPVSARPRVRSSPRSLLRRDAAWRPACPAPRRSFHAHRRSAGALDCR